MIPDRAQSVADADRDIRQYLVRVAAVLGDALGDELAGLYVYGSLATGCYRREHSDIDLMVVVSRSLEEEERRRLARVLVRLSDERPVRGDIEVTVMTQASARAFAYPTPYELHYSSLYHEPFRRGTFDFSIARSDAELPAQLLELRERGFALVGPPPDRMFAYVPWYAYVCALRADFDWASERVEQLPVYAVLNACRILHGATSRVMGTLNKDEAARWALQTIPQQFHAPVRDALNVYRGVKAIDDVVFVRGSIEGLRAYVFDRSRAAFERAADTEDE